MNQLDKKNCTEIGFIQKPHGLKGEVIVVFQPEFEQEVDSGECLLVEAEGGLVPFFISEEGARYRTSDSVILKFDHLDSHSGAKELAGCKIFLPNEEVFTSEASRTYNSFIGMNVTDEQAGELGPVTKLDDFSGNIVITVAHPEAEIMIPLSENIITGIDTKNKKLFLTCPEGLIDLYLE